MWKTEHSEETNASPDAIWKILSDADNWPSWNPGLSWVRMEGPFQKGATGRTKPAKGPESTFILVEVRAGNAFINETKLPGAHMRFQHFITPLGDGRVRVMLGATIDGPMSRVYGLMFGREIKGHMPIALKQLVILAETGATSSA